MNNRPGGGHQDYLYLGSVYLSSPRGTGFFLMVWQEYDFLVIML